MSLFLSGRDIQAITGAILGLGTLRQSVTRPFAHRWYVAFGWDALPFLDDPNQVTPGNGSSPGPPALNSSSRSGWGTRPRNTKGSAQTEALRFACGSFIPVRLSVAATVKSEETPRRARGRAEVYYESERTPAIDRR